MNLGAHMSIAGGIHLALERGLSIDCRAVQLFVKSSNQWRAKPLSETETEKFRELLSQFSPGMVIGHSSYLINIASPDPDLLEKSRKALVIELERCETLGIPWLVLHPGSHRDAGVDAGLDTIGESLDAVFDRMQESPPGGTRAGILLEMTAGMGNTMGRSFEELAAMYERTSARERIGFCYDTCHAFAAGYDISTRKKYKDVFDSFDSTIGLEKLRAFHLNDSKTPLGSGKDRHENIGEGHIGLGPFKLLVNDPRFREVPMILETPKGPDLKEDVETLALLRSLRK